MRKIILFSLLCMAALQAAAQQVPDGINFQALINDPAGNPAKARMVHIRASIKQNDPAGNIVFSESFVVQTSDNGVFSVVIGQGKRITGSGSLSGLAWTSGPYFLNIKAAIEPTVPTDEWKEEEQLVDMGTSQFWSVPFAFTAAKVAGMDLMMKLADTTAMLQPYLRSADTLSLSNRIDRMGNQTDTALLMQNVMRKTDAAQMLLPYLQKNDTAAFRMLYAQSMHIDTSLSGDSHFTPADTADMLKPYLKAADTASLGRRIDDKLNSADTIAMLQPYALKADIQANYLNISDTAAMLVDFIRRTDIQALFDTIAGKLSVADTTAMLSGYMRKSDTSWIDNRIAEKIAGLGNGGLTGGYMTYADTVALAGRINSKLPIADTARMLLPYMKYTDTAALSNRIAEKLTIADTSAMLAGYARQHLVLKYADTAALLADRLRFSDTSAMLSGYVRSGNQLVTDTGSLSVRIDAAVKYSDSTTAFITPRQLQDTINAIKTSMAANAVDTFTTNPTLYLPSGFTLGKYANGNVAQWKGLTAKEALLEAIVTSIPPTYTAPTVSLSASPATTVEIGSSISVSLTASFHQNDGGAATATVFKRGSTTVTSPDAITITTPVSYTAQVTYGQGPVKNNNLGNADASGQIAAGTATSNTITYTPAYKRYFGWISDTTGIATAGFNDALITALGNELNSAKSKTWNTGSPASPRFYVFAYTATSGPLSTASFNGIPSLNALNMVNRSFTNAQGYTTNYYIYYSKQALSTSSDITTN